MGTAGNVWLIALQGLPQGLVDKVTAVRVVAIVYQHIDSGQGGGVDVDRYFFGQAEAGVVLQICFSLRISLESAWRSSVARPCPKM